MSGSRSVQQATILSLGTNGDVRTLLPYILHHSTVAYWPLLMVHHSQSWKHQKDFTPFQRPDADRGGSFVGIPTQTALTNQKAAGLQCQEHPRTDVPIKVVEHHDQVEAGGFELILHGIERQQVQLKIELLSFLPEFRDATLGDAHDCALPVSLRQPQCMP